MSTKKQLSEYNKSYYHRNKNSISRRRKKKYWGDPSYRNVLRAASRQHYDETSKGGKDPTLGYTVKRADGRDLYTISYASQVISRSDDFIRSWEKSGTIPSSTYTDSRGWRLYTAQQIEVLSIAFRRYDSGDWTREIVRSYLTNNWDK